MSQSLASTRSQDERARLQAEIRWFGLPLLLAASGVIICVLDASLPGWSGGSPVIGYGILGAGFVLTLRALILSPPIVSRFSRQ